MWKDAATLAMSILLVPQHTQAKLSSIHSFFCPKCLMQLLAAVTFRWSLEGVSLSRIMNLLHLHTAADADTAVIPSVHQTGWVGGRLLLRLIMTF